MSFSIHPLLTPLITNTDIVMSSREEPFHVSSHRITNVFMQMGWRSEQQHLNVTKLLGITGALPEPLLETCPKDRLMTDDEAIQMLGQLSFASEKEAFDFLLKTTQAKWIRKAAPNEGVNKKAEDNRARWLVQDEGLILDNKPALQQISENLGFFGGSSWILSDPVTEILLMGGLESHIAERLEALEQLTPAIAQHSNLYYLTGPRGVFNDEPSLAAILAQKWFNDASLEDAIQSTLVNQKGWDGNPATDRTAQMKLLILAALGRIEQNGANEIIAQLDAKQSVPIADELIEAHWPKNCGFYFQAPDKYDAHTAGWPVAADIVDFRLQQIQQKAPGIYDQLRIVPVIARGKNGRLANTADTIEQWLLDRGNRLSSWLANHPYESSQLTVASLSSQPHALYMHETARVSLRGSGIRFVTVSVPTTNFQIATVLDVAARWIFTMKNEFVSKSLVSLAHHLGRETDMFAIPTDLDEQIASVISDFSYCLSLLTTHSYGIIEHGEPSEEQLYADIDKLEKTAHEYIEKRNLFLAEKGSVGEFCMITQKDIANANLRKKVDLYA